MTGTQAATVGNANPIRYRGYYYDQETGYYYLQSRYYDPETQRFLNADGYVSTGQGILGYNMFAYCGNNPVNFSDLAGESLIAALLLGGAVIGTIFLAGCSKKSEPKPQSEPSKPTKPSSSSSTSNTSQSSSIVTNKKPSPQEKSYAATVYAEAGGQNKRTKQAVAHVMNNRVGTRKSWSNIDAVLSAKYQFSGYNSPMYQEAMNYYNYGICDNLIEKAAMDECMEVVIPIYSGAEADITGGALYFHSFANPDEWQYHDSYTQVYVEGTEGFWFYK